MERVKLMVAERTDTGSRAVNRLRKQGIIPGVLYGAGKPAVPISVPSHDLRAAISTSHGMHAVLDVVLEGHKRAHHAVIQEVQLDPVKSLVTHVDLREVKLTEPIEASVAVQIEGVSPGVKAGGTLEVVTHEVRVKALPADIPEHLILHVDGLAMNDVARVRDLEAVDGVELLHDPEETICTIIPPRVVAEGEEAAEAAGEEEAAEPELVGKPAESQED